MFVLDHAQSMSHLTAVDPVAIVEACFRLNDGEHIRQPDPPVWGIGASQLGTRIRFKGCFIDTVPIYGFRLTCLMSDQDSGHAAMRWVLLVDPESGAALALVDEHALYQERVAAAVGVGLRAIAAKVPAVIGVLGAGRLARTSLLRLGSLFPGVRLCVASRTRPRADALAAAVADQVQVQVLESAEEIMEGCDAVVTATNASEPVVESGWARPGQILCTLGSRELPDEIYQGASAVVASDRVISAHASDIRELAARKVIDPETVFTADVGELLRDERELSADEVSGVVVFRSDGFVAQDVLLAHAVWSRARAQEAA